MIEWIRDGEMIEWIRGTCTFLLYKHTHSDVQTVRF